MFDSLDEQIKRDEDRVSTPAQRIMRYAIYVAAAAVIVAGVLIGVHYMN